MEENEEENTKLSGKGKWEEEYACKILTQKDAVNRQIPRKASETSNRYATGKLL
jgi:hypothetical protein